MKRATTFMVEKVAYRGGYVWSYLPDFSRRWGELEARETMIWVQPPGTGSMGHLFLDAYHATGDEYYYRAAEQAADALIHGQHPSGGWNYLIDFAGEKSLRDWYATIGRNAWRLEEFHRYDGNATFDDGGTAEAAKFLLRIYLEKRDAKYKPALDQAIQFFLDAQHPVGAWPQRFPPRTSSTDAEHDYTTYLTFNDDVAAENIDFLLLCYRALGERRLLEPIQRAMNAFLVTQLNAPQAGWALQYTPDLKPAAARSYEPLALATQGTARNVERLLTFYRLTGDPKFLSRIPEALDWLESCQLPAELRINGRTHPTFVEFGTNKPLFLHRRGSNVSNGRYFVDSDPHETVGHYSSTRTIQLAALREAYEKTKALPPTEVTRDSPLFAERSAERLPPFFTERKRSTSDANDPKRSPPSSEAVVINILQALNADGYWPTPLARISHPYVAQSAQKQPGNYAATYVGDETDTSPFSPPQPVVGISTAVYIHNMNLLIRYLAGER